MADPQWRQRLNNLLQKSDLGREALAWQEYQAGAQHTSDWEAIAYIRSIEYGRGRAHTLADAKETAARIAYEVLFQQLYG
ncbi:hypothetical protein QCA50_010174 [Cerrena zonata]|uniref:DRBM domain-containing protein n=1 Tax=Cerrena zonata TaxID=2478898 RepID=A0AAW0G8K9_9APHY